MRGLVSSSECVIVVRDVLGIEFTGIIQHVSMPDQCSMASYCPLLPPGQIQVVSFVESPAAAATIVSVIHHHGPGSPQAFIYVVEFVLERLVADGTLAFMRSEFCGCVHYSPPPFIAAVSCILMPFAAASLPSNAPSPPLLSGSHEAGTVFRIFWYSISCIFASIISFISASLFCKASRVFSTHHSFGISSKGMKSGLIEGLGGSKSRQMVPKCAAQMPQHSKTKHIEARAISHRLRLWPLGIRHLAIRNCWSNGRFL